MHHTVGQEVHGITRRTVVVHTLRKMPRLMGFMFLLITLTYLVWFLNHLPDGFTQDSSISGTSTNASLRIQEWRYKDFSSWYQWNNLTGFSYFIVPNIVHFIKFQNYNLTFTEMVAILSAWCHQRPDRLIIHCDCDNLIGPYWEKLKGLKGVEVRRIQKPSIVLKQPIVISFSGFHTVDVARIAVLQDYGGIALDLDTYVVRSLDEFRHFECTVAWPENENIGNQIIISHKNSRFIQLYGDSYHSYNGSLWDYNASKLPTRILELLPHIVHRIPLKFGVHFLKNQLYNYSTWNEWKSYYSINLGIRRFNSELAFDEHNIRTDPHAFGQMARLVLFGTTDLIPHNKTVDWNYTRCRK